MPVPRTIFMGSPAFAVPSLSALAERPDLCDLVGVVTQPDKPAGRGRKLTPCPVKIAAQARGLPVLEPRSVKRDEALSAFKEMAPDLIVVAAYGKILPPSVLDLPPLGCINVHASILPSYRGASPIAHAIINGEQQAGVTIMKMDVGLDTGPHYSHTSIPIRADHTCGTLTVALATLGAELLIATLPGISDGTSEATAQAESGVSYAPLLQKNDGVLDFSQPADELERRVRGLNPWPGTFTLARGNRIVVTRASLEAGADGQPGEVLSANSKGVVVACREGALRLEEVRPAGRKLMAAGAWVAGRGVQTGDVLGEEDSSPI